MFVVRTGAWIRCVAHLRLDVYQRERQIERPVKAVIDVPAKTGSKNDSRDSPRNMIKLRKNIEAKHTKHLGRLPLTRKTQLLTHIHSPLHCCLLARAYHVVATGMDPPGCMRRAKRVYFFETGQPPCARQNAREFFLSAFMIAWERCTQYTISNFISLAWTRVLDRVRQSAFLCASSFPLPVVASGEQQAPAL